MKKSNNLEKKSKINFNNLNLDQTIKYKLLTPNEKGKTRIGSPYVFDCRLIQVKKKK